VEVIEYDETNIAVTPFKDTPANPESDVYPATTILSAAKFASIEVVLVSERAPPNIFG
jgi:hypothetical protein